MQRDLQLNSNVLSIHDPETDDSFGQSSLVCPGWQKTLGITLPFLYVILRVAEDQHFTMEVTVSDATNHTRRLRFSTFQHEPSLSPHLCCVPLHVVRDAWCYVPLDLASLLSKAYPRSSYESTARVQIHGNCLLRRVYFADKSYAEHQLPAELRLWTSNAAAPPVNVAGDESSAPQQAAAPQTLLDGLFQRPSLDDEDDLL